MCHVSKIEHVTCFLISKQEGRVCDGRANEYRPSQTVKPIAERVDLDPIMEGENARVRVQYTAEPSVRLSLLFCLQRKSRTSFVSEQMLTTTN